MGRNKDLRKRVAGHQRVIDAHETKIRLERAKSQPNEELIKGWEDEIEVQRRAMAKLTQRLKREW